MVTSSETIDESKTMIKQVLTGERYLANSDSGNTIPGTGTLSTGIKVKAAANGTEIKPEFNIWIDGNPDSDIKTVVSDPIIVSAAPNTTFPLLEIAELTILDTLIKKQEKLVLKRKMALNEEDSQDMH